MILFRLVVRTLALLLLAYTAYAGTLSVTVLDADSLTPVNNSNVSWTSNMSNFHAGIFDFFNLTPANGTVTNNSVDPTATYYIKVVGGDNESTPALDYEPFRLDQGVSFRNLYLTRYDAQNIPNLNITYAGANSLSLEIPVQPAFELNITGVTRGQSVKLRYSVFGDAGYGDFSTREGVGGPVVRFNASTTSELLAVKNQTGWVNYSWLPENNIQGFTLNLTPTLEQGYNVTFNLTGTYEDLIIEVRNASQDTGMPFDTSLIALVEGYNRSGSFFETLLLPNGTYNFLFHSRGYTGTWNRSVEVNGSDITVEVPPLHPSGPSYLWLNRDEIRTGENLTGTLNNGTINGGIFYPDRLDYAIYTDPGSEFVKPTLQASGTVSQMSALGGGMLSFTIPDPGLLPGEYSLILNLTNSSLQAYKFTGFKFAVVNSRLEVDLKPSARPNALVNAFVIAKNGTSSIGGMKVKLELTSPDHNFWTVVKTSSTTDSQGKTTLTFNAPNATGTYFVKLTGTKQGYTAREYRMLRVQNFQVTAMPDRPSVRPGEKVNITITTSYFNGTPLANAIINTSVHTDFQDWENVTYLDETTTDDDGKAQINYTPTGGSQGLMLEITATKNSEKASTEVFLFIPLYTLSVDTDRFEYDTGENVNITIQVTGENATNLQFLNGSMNFKDPHQAGMTAMTSGKNAFALLMNPETGGWSVVNVTHLGSGVYNASLSTAGLSPGWYNVMVMVMNSEGMPAADGFADFRVNGGLEVAFQNMGEDIFKSYKLNDDVNITVKVTNRSTGEPVGNGTLNYKVGMPWEIFAPKDFREEMGFAPRLDRTVDLVNGTGYVNFTLNASFKENRTMPMVDEKHVGTPPLILYVTATVDKGTGSMDIPIFLSDLNVNLTSNGVNFNRSGTVNFTINVTDSTGQSIPATFETPEGTTGRMVVFGPHGEHDIPITCQTPGNCTASYNLAEDVAGEYFAMVVASSGDDVAGSGVHFMVSTFNLNLSLDKTSYTAGDTITATVNASENLGTVDIQGVLLSPSHIPLNLTTLGSTSLPRSISLVIPTTAKSGLYTLKVKVTDPTGNTGATEKSFEVENANLKANITILDGNNTPTSLFHHNDTIKFQVNLTGIPSVTLRVYKPPSGDLLYEAAGITSGVQNTTIPPDAPLGDYFVRLDTTDTIGVASAGFTVVGGG